MIKKYSRGFTLIELLTVAGVIGILIIIVLVVVKPTTQYANARDTQRKTDLYAITTAIYRFATEHNGNLPDTDGDDSTSNFPQSPTCIGTNTGGPDNCFNISKATNEAGTESIVPTYLSAIPVDPSTGTQADTQYVISVDSDGKIVASATGETVPVITVIR